VVWELRLPQLVYRDGQTADARPARAPVLTRRCCWLVDNNISWRVADDAV
jgi:hypothetical protein